MLTGIHHSKTSNQTIKMKKWLSAVYVLLLGFNLQGQNRPVKTQEKDNLIILEGATLIDGTNNQPITNSVLLVRDSRIERVGQIGDFSYPDEATILSLKGKYIIPGLIDVHVHIQTPIHEEVMKMLLAYGITSIRIPGGTDIGIKVRDMVKKGELLGPNVFTGGSLIDGEGSQDVMKPMLTEEDIRKEIRRQYAQGVDLIKLYVRLPPNLVKAGIQEAHSLGLPVIGHLTRTFWTEAAESGIDGLIHLGAAGPIGELIPLDKRKRLAKQNGLSLADFERKSHSLYFLRGAMGGRIEDSGQRIYDLIDLDSPETNRLMNLLVSKKIMVDPTLVTDESLAFGDEPTRILSHLEPYKAPNSVRNYLWGADWESSNKYANEEFPLSLYDKPLFQFGKELTLKFFENGVLLGAGSDVGMPWMTPGASLHRELELFAEAGIPEKEVLSIATRNGSHFVYQQNEVGTLETGKMADLVILSSNPLEDIRNTRAIELVMKSGKVYDPKVILEELKRED